LAIKGRHPQAIANALVATNGCATMVYDGAVDFSKGYSASGFAHGDKERKECDAMPGMMCAAWAAGGRSSRSRVQVCDECTLSPLGR
jgi:hypothetical protein